VDAMNKLHFGDNLNILREYVTDASVDLIYLEPPFNSSATYNVLFKEKRGGWRPPVLESEAVYKEIVESGPRKLAVVITVSGANMGENFVGREAICGCHRLLMSSPSR
jgi:site-specific DNA-methyltransferase (adenine-specific)